jgi:hypothetical protein
VVRGERAKDPLISVVRLEHALEDHFQRGFSHNYVSKIANGMYKKPRSRRSRTNFSMSRCPAKAARSSSRHGRAEDYCRGAL